MKKESVYIRVGTTDSGKVDDLIQFARTRYEATLGVTPHLSQEYMAVVKNGQIVVVVSIDFRRDVPLYCEDLYDIDLYDQDRFTPGAVVFYSKLTSIERKYVPLLMHAAVRYGIEKGYATACSILSESMVRYYAIFDIVWHHLPARLRIDRVPEEVSKYFLQTPEPGLYILPLVYLVEKTEQAAYVLMGSTSYEIRT